MHDESIERRLRRALHEEADVLPFTITAAELERRLVLRRRSFAGRRLTLLLAAAVGISLFGVGGALSGLFDQKQPTATSMSEASIAPSIGPSDTLPSLDDLLANDPNSVLVAQAQGPADGSPDPAEEWLDLPPATVGLGTFDPGHDYRVTFGCLGDAGLTLDIRVPGSRGPQSGPAVRCDGAMHDQTFNPAQAQSVGFSLTGPSSWRVVIRGEQARSVSPELAQIPPAPEGEQELVRWDQAAVDPGAQPWGATGLIAQQIGALPARTDYSLQTLCAAGSSIRVIFGGFVAGVIRAKTETLIACDSTLIRGAYLGFGIENGGEVFLAAKPDQQVSVVMTSAAPPVALTQRAPGWQLSGGIGPDYVYATTPMGFTGAGLKGGGPVLISMSCTGTQSIVVSVDVGKQTGTRVEKFTADCAPEGATTAQSFVAASYVSVDFVQPARTWVALTILIPDPEND